MLQCADCSVNKVCALVPGAMLSLRQSNLLHKASITNCCNYNCLLVVMSYP